MSTCLTAADGIPGAYPPHVTRTIVNPHVVHEGWESLDACCVCERFLKYNSRWR